VSVPTYSREINIWSTVVAQNGCALSAVKVGKIASLLSCAEMSIDDIARRMGCSQSTVKKINRTFRVREYAGRRTFWRTYEHDQRKLA